MRDEPARMTLVVFSLRVKSLIVTMRTMRRTKPSTMLKHTLVLSGRFWS
jgi:hypothetical protein